MTNNKNYRHKKDSRASSTSLLPKLGIIGLTMNKWYVFKNGCYLWVET